MKSGKNHKITVAVVEDDKDVRESLCKILVSSKDIHCVAACASGEEALTALPDVKPQVVLMDINMPGIDGVECVQRLVKIMPKVLVVMLTVHDDTESIFNSLRAGACGYLRKPVRADVLIDSVKDVSSGGSPMTGNIARKVIQAFSHSDSKKVALESSPADLTEKEQEVLNYLTQGYLYKEIADIMKISWHTVHSHIRHIYEKLHVRSRGEAVARYLGR